MSILGAGAPPPVVPVLPPTGNEAESDQPDRDDEQSRFDRAAEEAGLPSLAEIDVEQMLRHGGVDVDDPLVRDYINWATGQIEAAESDADVQFVLNQLQMWLPFMAARSPAGEVTAYADALSASGFREPLAPFAPAGRALAAYGLTPQDVRRATAKNFEVNPETGWIQYSTGVLVNPADGTMVFDPTTSAPGSPAWLQQVQSSWTPEKIEEWRKRLYEFGDLTKEQSKVDGIDQAFLIGLQNFHYRRYQNFGKAVPTDLAAIEGAGTTEFALTARDFQTQIQNDVREQFRRVFGNDPSDAELNDFTRSVTRIAVKLQRGFERKGASPESALSLASTEAEERMIARLEGSPESQFLQESWQENTRLRDALASAVVTTRSLSG